MTQSTRLRLTGVFAAVLVLLPGLLLAHGVADRDAAYLEQHSGLALTVFAYLGAKHMVTGYDHLLYLLAVIFFLYRMRDVAIYVTMFAVGHSITLLGGVLGGIDVDRLQGVREPRRLSEGFLDRAKSKDSRLRLRADSRIRPVYEAAGVRAVGRRLDRQHPRVQRRRRDRSIAGADDSGVRGHVAAGNAPLRSLRRCIRVLINWNTTKTQREVCHIYLKDATRLRPDLSDLPPVDMGELQHWIESHLVDRDQ